MSEQRKAKFAVVLEDDEHILFYVNGEEVGSANHDEQGWSGMRAMQTMFEDIAGVVGARFVEVETVEEAQ